MKAAPVKFPALDLLRSLAIIIVFFWHYRQSGSPEWVNSIGQFGWTGVDLFFVLSGYLIGNQLMAKVGEGHKISLKNFYLKRALRILPAYITVLILYYTIPAFSEKNGMPPPWRFLSFTQNFGLDYRTEGAFSHAWSLCIEEQFYLLFPVLLSLLLFIRSNKISIALLLLIFCFGFLTRIYSWDHYVLPVYGNDELKGEMAARYFKYVYYPSYNRLDGLLIGITIAAIFNFKTGLRKKIICRGNFWLALGLLTIILSAPLCIELFSFNAAVFSYPLASAGYGFLVLAALSPSSILYKMDFRIFSVISTLAFSVYLTHKQVIHLIKPTLSQHLDPNITFIVCFIASVCAGALLYLCIERPFLLLRQRILAQSN